VTSERFLWCRAIVLLAALLLPRCRGHETRSIKPGSYAGAPILLISIDTLRADHLPAWGFQGIHTPNIDRLRRDGVLFRNAYSHCPLTLPSHVSLLTGKLPAETGVRDNLGYTVAPSESAALPQLFAKQGYATGGAVSAYVLRGETGLARLFGWYEDRLPFQPGAPLGEIQRRGADTVTVAKGWLQQNAGTPFFFFLHLYEPHAPYTPPEPYRSSAPTLYDGEIEYADSLIGDLLDTLVRQKLYDRTIIVLVSDHGEGLGDHGEKEHGIFVYRESIHVPLIIKLPHGDGAGGSIEAPVGLVDILPTLTGLTGLATPAGVSGKPLFGTAPQEGRRIFSESMYARLHLGWADLRSLSDAEHQYINAPRAELYDLQNDPAERVNVIADQRRVASALRQELDGYTRKVTPPSAVSPEEKSRLASLGYLTQPASTPAGVLPDPKDRIAEFNDYERTAELMGAKAEQAIVILRKILEKNPLFTDAALRLARAYEATGRFSDAAAVYRSVLVRDPALTEQVAIGLATAYLNMRMYGDARSHAELAIRSNPGGAHLLLAEIDLAAGDAQTAERDARAAAADPHYHGPAMLALAESLIRQKRCPEALEVIDGLGTDTRPAGTGIRRASALVCLERMPEAVAALREEIAVAPAEREAYAQLAAIYLMQRQLDEAESVLGRMVTVLPSPSNYQVAVMTLRHFGYGDAAAQWERRAQAGR
jgi:choline-sulfatase